VINFLISKDLPVRGISHPLSGLPNRFRKQFFDDIGKDNKKRVFEAIDFYMDKNNGKEER